jgi:hypothetical protein
VAASACFVLASAALATRTWPAFAVTALLAGTFCFVSPRLVGHFRFRTPVGELDGTLSGTERLLPASVTQLADDAEVSPLVPAPTVASQR